MSSFETGPSSARVWWWRVRELTPLVSLLAFIGFLIPHFLIEHFEPQAFKWAVGAHRPAAWQFFIRNVCFFLLLLSALVSFLRGRTLIPFVIAFALLLYAAQGV